MTPVEVDILFKETVQQLKVSPSERIRLNLIDQFIEAIAGFEKNYQSYLIQLVEELPSLPNPLLFAGIHPSNLQGFIRRLETACTSISELKKNEFLDSRIDEYKSVLEQIMQWLGASTLEEEVQTKLVESKAAKISIIPGEVIVPVVEEFNGITAGRLRRLKVEIIGPAKEGHELKPNFGIVGAEIGNFAKTVESAVLALANESEGTRHQCWKASVQFELPHAWHTGSSANLAMAGAFFGEQMKAEEQQELFWLNPAACITGDLDKQGNVLPVNPQTIPQKVDAAFFSWCQLLIVPSEQLAEVHEQIAELNAEFPNRRLPVVGVSHLRELFYDRRVTLYKKETTLAHNAKKAWRRRKSVGAISLIATLILVISSLVYGPVDRNPVSFELNGNVITFFNESGQKLNNKVIDEYAAKHVEQSSIFGTVSLVEFIDIDNDGINEIILGTTSTKENQVGHLSLLSSNATDTIWSNPLKFDIEYQNHLNANTINYRPGFLKVVDIDFDGDQEILVTLQQNEYFKSRVGIFDSKTGGLLNSIDGAGHFTSLETFNIDDDLNLELLICGYFKGYNMAGCAIVDTNASGFLPLHTRYWDKDKTLTYIHTAFMVPKTEVGRYFDSKSELYVDNIVFRSTYEPIQDQLKLFVRESIIDENENVSRAFTVINTNKNFDNFSIVSDDYFDRYWAKFNEATDIKSELSSNLLLNHVDSFFWWDGSNWTNKKGDYLK